MTTTRPSSVLLNEASSSLPINKVVDKYLSEQASDDLVGDIQEIMHELDSVRMESSLEKIIVELLVQLGTLSEGPYPAITRLMRSGGDFNRITRTVVAKASDEDELTRIMIDAAAVESALLKVRRSVVTNEAVRLVETLYDSMKALQSPRANIKNLLNQIRVDMKQFSQEF